MSSTHRVSPNFENPDSQIRGSKHVSRDPQADECPFIFEHNLEPAVMDLDLSTLDDLFQHNTRDSSTSINAPDTTATSLPWLSPGTTINEPMAENSLNTSYLWQDQLDTCNFQIPAQLQSPRSYNETVTSTQILDETSPNLIENPISPTVPQPRVLRKQNHACDACRTAKKACDLPPRRPSRRSNGYAITANKACSLCTTRGLDCTISWLANKPTRKRSTRPDADNTVVDPISRPATTLAVEHDIARQIVARDTRAVQFSFYVDSFEMPIAHCLLRGSLPPIYKLGLEAITELGNMAAMSQHVEMAESWIKACGEVSKDSPWTESMCSAPHLFRTVSVLDAIFESVLFPRITKLKHASITETYKQVAFAMASQYTVKGPTATVDTPSRGHDLSLVTFRKARELIFSNISTVGSFRLAFTMLIFGTVAPPGCGEELEGFLQDTQYVFQKGQRRLQTLCANAQSALRALFESNQPPRSSQGAMSLPRAAVPLVAELVGVLQWFIDLCHSVVFSTSQSQSDNYSSSDSMVAADSPASSDSSQASIVSPVLAVMPDPQSQEAEDSIVAQAENSTCSLLSQWKHDGATDILSFIDSSRRVTSVGVLLWRSLARLSAAAQSALQGATGAAAFESVEPLYVGMSALIRLWRATFGTLDIETRLYPNKHAPVTWRLLSICSNDADLSILLFCGVAQRLERHMGEDPHSFSLKDTQLYRRLREDTAFRKEQSLISARHAAIIAQAAHSTPNNGESTSRSRSVSMLSMSTVSFRPSRTARAHAD